MSRTPAKPAAAPVWVVTRAKGLHSVPAADEAGVIADGGRRAAERDLAVAGVDADAGTDTIEAEREIQTATQTPEGGEQTKTEA